VHLLLVLLLVHVDVVYLHVLEHVDASLLLNVRHDLSNGNPVPIAIIANLPDLAPVEGLILYLGHDVDQAPLAVLVLVTQLVSDLTGSLLLTDHDVQIKDMMEHVLHVSFEDSVVLFVQLLGMVLGFWDTVSFGQYLI